MANPIKIAKLVSKQVKKRDAIRTEVRKKAYSAAPLNVKSSTGKTKVNKKVEKLDAIADARTHGNIGYVYQKGKLIEKFDNHPPIKTKPRALTKRLNQMAPDKKQTLKQVRKVTPKKPGIPVKKRGN